jgi:ABC-type multidrug transport system ATPase subunit
MLFKRRKLPKSSVNGRYWKATDQLADTVAVIDHGRILTHETPAKLKSRPGNERLDIKLADPAVNARIPMLRMNAL